jgi:hypothetical protein
MEPLVPLDTSIEAEFEDGFVLSETAEGDVARFAEKGNTLTDLLGRHAEAEHGPMVRFSLYYLNTRYDVDWTQVPDNARPIRFRHGFHTRNLAGETVARGFAGVDFGYQWNDERGKNRQEVLVLRDPAALELIGGMVATQVNGRFG